MLLGLDEHAEFAQMARQYTEKKRLPLVQRDALLAFAALRNAIVTIRKSCGARPHIYGLTCTLTFSNHTISEYLQRDQP